jgi:hypothetical protein
VTSGATSDLKTATRVARHMVVDCGMSDVIGPGELAARQGRASWAYKFNSSNSHVIWCCYGAGPLEPVAGYKGDILMNVCFIGGLFTVAPSGGGAVAVGEEPSPATRHAVDAEVQAMLKGAYQRVVGWAAWAAALAGCWHTAVVVASAISGHRALRAAGWLLGNVSALRHRLWVFASSLHNSLRWCV